MVFDFVEKNRYNTLDASNEFNIEYVIIRKLGLVHQNFHLKKVGYSFLEKNNKT